MSLHKLFIPLHGKDHECDLAYAIEMLVRTARYAVDNPNVENASHRDRAIVETLEIAEALAGVLYEAVEDRVYG